MFKYTVSSFRHTTETSLSGSLTMCTWIMTSPFRQGIIGVIIKPVKAVVPQQVNFFIIVLYAVNPNGLASGRIEVSEVVEVPTLVEDRGAHALLLLP